MRFVRSVATLAVASILASPAPSARAASGPPAAVEPVTAAISAANLRAHVHMLASDAMQGREAATRELEIAGDYAASVLALAGAEPAGDTTGTPDKRMPTYFQNFEVNELTPVSQALSLESRSGDTIRRSSFEPKVDFTTTGTATSSITAPLVFVGYGYSVKDAGWDDYAGVDVKGKIAVAIDGGPGKSNDASWFWKPENRRRYFGRFGTIYKAMAAEKAGAVALIVIDAPNSDNPPFTRDMAENRPPREEQFAKGVRNLPPRREMVLANEPAGSSIHGGFSGVSTVRVTERVAQAIFEGTGESTAALQKKLDAAMKPAPMALAGRSMTIDVKVDAKVLTTRNVIAKVTGSDPKLKDEVVVIGAHYDHEGARGGYVWAGADDNASGTAAVLELARAFAQSKVKPARTIVFALWAAEEKGLLGSKHYIDHPVFPIDRTVAYINLDMIGRDGDPAAGGDPHAAVGGPVQQPKLDLSAKKIDPANWMAIEGSDTYPSLGTITEAGAKHVGLEITYKPAEIRFAASDHLYFARSGVPIISYFDGGHVDYHQPSDTPEKLNYPKMEKVARLCALTLWDLAAAPGRPEKVAPKPAAGAPATGRPGMGLPYFVGETGDGEAGVGQHGGPPVEMPTPKPKGADLTLPGEKHFRNVKQLTFGGENAEAYFSFDNKWLSFQTTRDGVECDQIFVMGTDGSKLRRVSSGKGRTTCAYFMPGGKKVLYASTHLGGDACPPKPDFSKGYVWALYPEYDIFVTDLKTGKLDRLTSTPGYDAEATLSPDGRKIVFTSVRDGDLDIYTMNLDGSDVKRLTTEPGYDGGAFYSADSKWIVYRASRPEAGETMERYKSLLSQGLIEPRALEIWVMRADGSDKRRITSNGKANFAPFFHPDGKRIIFASNMDDPKGRNFDIYIINVDGTGLERVTMNETFDGFPMFSKDGKRLVFASNRNAAKVGETNLFIADWVR